AAGLAGPGLGPVRHDDHLRPAGRPARRPARPDPGAGRRHRRQPAGHHPPVPPGHRRRRRHAGLRRRRGTQAATARPRGRAPGGPVVTNADWQETDWQAIATELDAQGCARTPRLLTPAQCRDLAALYDKPELFRSTIDMARHRFGSGQYRYFTHDLPEPVRELREALYPKLLVIARDWAGRLG